MDNLNGLAFSSYRRCCPAVWLDVQLWVGKAQVVDAFARRR